MLSHILRAVGLLQLRDDIVHAVYTCPVSSVLVSFCIVCINSKSTQRVFLSHQIDLAEVNSWGVPHGG